MVTIKTKYPGDLRTEILHVASGETIQTDAPKDNHGKGEYFSPTDLVCAALGSCMISLMGIIAQRDGMNIDGATLDITKHILSDPRRISEIEIILNIPDRNLSEKQKEMLKHTALTCPVARSLHPDIVQNVMFNFCDPSESFL